MTESSRESVAGPGWVCHSPGKGLMKEVKEPQFSWLRARLLDH
jgi:hypothetical protein